jgi:hypothetical protein
MKLDISASGLASFEEDEPAGFMTPADRDELNRRRAEAQRRVEDRKSTDVEDAAATSRARSAKATQTTRRRKP